VNHQIVFGIFREGRFDPVPPAISNALALIVSGRRDEAKALFSEVGRIPQEQWITANDIELVIDARWSAWMLDGCPATP